MLDWHQSHTLAALHDATYCLNYFTTQAQFWRTVLTEEVDQGDRRTKGNPGSVWRSAPWGRQRHEGSFSGSKYTGSRLELLTDSGLANYPYADTPEYNYDNGFEVNVRMDQLLIRGLGLVWLKMGIIREPLWMQHWTSRSHKLWIWSQYILGLIYYFTYFSTVIPSNSCFSFL